MRWIVLSYLSIQYAGGINKRKYAFQQLIYWRIRKWCVKMCFSVSLWSHTPRTISRNVTQQWLPGVLLSLWGVRGKMVNSSFRVHSLLTGSFYLFSQSSLSSTVTSKCNLVAGWPSIKVVGWALKRQKNNREDNVRQGTAEMKERLDGAWVASVMNPGQNLDSDKSLVFFFFKHWLTSAGCRGSKQWNHWKAAVYCLKVNMTKDEPRTRTQWA